MVAKLSHASTANIFVGCVGVDLPANAIKQNYKNHNFVNVDKHVRTIDNMSSGIANVMVDQSTGHNRIILVTGANGMFSAEHVQDSWSDIVYVIEHCQMHYIVLVPTRIPCYVNWKHQFLLHCKHSAMPSKIN